MTSLYRLVIKTNEQPQQVGEGRLELNRIIVVVFGYFMNLRQDHVVGGKVLMTQLR